MANTQETIDHTTLERLVEARAVRGAEVIGQKGGWSVIIKYGMTERALAAKRGAIRVFRKFETLVGYLKSIGIAQYNVNAADFDPQTMRNFPARPDSAARLNRAHEAAAYANWLEKEVQAAIDDPRPSVPNEETKQHFARKRETLRKRIATEKA